MDENTARIVGRTQSLDGLANIETNAKRQGAYSDELQRALQIRAAEICRPLVIEQTGLAVDDLIPIVLGTGVQMYDEDQRKRHALWGD